jgi:PAS domain S-box-containing protein
MDPGKAKKRAPRRRPRAGGRAAALADARGTDLLLAFENAEQEMCLCDADDRIVMANRAFRERNSERSGLIVRGTRYEDYLRSGLELGLPAEAVGREEAWLAQRLRRRREGGRPFEQQLTRDRWMLISDQRLPDGGLLTTGLDISDRKRAEEANRRFRAAMDASADMILLIDRAAMRYVDVNENVCRILGYSREEILAMGPQDVLPIAREELERDYDAFIADPSKISGLRSQYRCKDGKIIPFESTRRLLHLADGTIIVAISRDSRAQLAAEREMRELNQSLERRVAERTRALETAVRELEAFSYSVSHDLRAPLRALDGHAHMLVEAESARLTPEGRRHLDAIEGNARRMGELVDALLDLARVNRTELSRRSLDVGAIALAVVAELRPHFARAEAVVGPIPELDGDPVLVRQVLVNLIGNAFKYSAKADAPRIEIGWDEAVRAVRVSDNGVGFDMDHAAKLFGTFERLHTLGEFEGTGVGLAIVKRIVERHGGRVWGEAQPGRGARFYFNLTSPG